MFDSIVYESAPSYPQTINKKVEEHRAPTDASITLLREMERKLERDVLSRSTLRSNTFNAEWVVIDEPMLMQQRVVCRFDLNGATHQFEERIEERLTLDEIKRIVHDGIIRKLAGILTDVLFMTRVRDLARGART